ncbi:hypothetical protein D9M73_78590 [compost metagenome]
MSSSAAATKIYAQLERGHSPSEVKASVRTLLLEFEDERTAKIATMGAAQKHPLGFFALRWNVGVNQVLRVHLWSKNFKWVQHPNWQIHNHIFEFDSLILHGTIQNKTYEKKERKKGRWSIYEVDYADQNSTLIHSLSDVALGLTGTTVQRDQSKYSLAAEVLHRSILRSESAITVLAARTTAQANFKPIVIGAGNAKEFTFDRRVTNHVESGMVLRQFLKILDTDS